VYAAPADAASNQALQARNAFGPGQHGGGPQGGPPGGFGGMSGGGFPSGNHGRPNGFGGGGPPMGFHGIQGRGEQPQLQPPKIVPEGDASEMSDIEARGWTGGFSDGRGGRGDGRGRGGFHGGH